MHFSMVVVIPKETFTDMKTDDERSKAVLKFVHENLEPLVKTENPPKDGHFLSYKVGGPIFILREGFRNQRTFIACIKDINFDAMLLENIQTETDWHNYTLNLRADFIKKDIEAGLTKEQAEAEMLKREQADRYMWMPLDEKLEKVHSFVPYAIYTKNKKFYENRSYGTDSGNVWENNFRKRFLEKLDPLDVLMFFTCYRG